ncbi:MAG: DUF1345 domain-containing protein [Candidatus Saccharimonadales bacterium]
MAVKYAPGKKTSSAKLKIFVALLAGTLTGIAAGKLGALHSAPLLGWDVAAIIYLVWTWITVWPMSQADTKSHAVREDPSRAASDLVVLVASVVSLIAVGLILIQSGNSQGALQLLQVALGFVSVVVSWSVVHTLFTLRYAELYYGKSQGGVDFNEKDAPMYKDFAYLAFTVGMTFQVSDTEISSKQIRHTILRQALISYMFGTVILASTINLVAGLGK